MSTKKANGAATPAYDSAVAAFLGEIYSSCNVTERLRRDPLAVVKEYPDPADREIAALVCSTLAFGGVDLIMRACRVAMVPLGPRPAVTLGRMGESEIREAWGSFQYRYCFSKDMTALMIAAKRIRDEVGSLEEYFLRGDPGGPDIIAAAGVFVRGLVAKGKMREHGANGSGIRPNLLPDPQRGSACKRLLLFLRWMVRCDDVDPGGWDRMDRSRLVVPLDTHMVRVCRERLGFIDSPHATMKNALTATVAFRLYAPDDPVKYDFALTRPGIDPDPGDERFGCG